VAELSGTQPGLDVPDFVVGVRPALLGATGDSAREPYTCESAKFCVICDKGVFFICATVETSSDAVAACNDARGVDIFLCFPVAGVVFFPGKNKTVLANTVNSNAQQQINVNCKCLPCS